MVIVCGVLTGLNKGAFYKCTALTSITLPNDLKIIQEYTFERCEKLKKIKLPEKLSYISENAFRDCISLESVTIPSSVWSIEEDAFIGCKNLKYAYFEEKSGWKQYFRMHGSSFEVDLSKPSKAAEELRVGLKLYIYWI